MIERIKTVVAGLGIVSAIVTLAYFARPQPPPPPPEVTVRCSVPSLYAVPTAPGVYTCIPKTYIWGAMAEYAPEGQSDVLASGAMEWRRISFSVYAKGDQELASRWLVKLAALALDEAAIDERLKLLGPAYNDEVCREW